MLLLPLLLLPLLLLLVGKLLKASLHVGRLRRSGRLIRLRLLELLLILLKLLLVQLLWVGLLPGLLLLLELLLIRLLLVLLQLLILLLLKLLRLSLLLHIAAQLSGRYAAAWQAAARQAGLGLWPGEQEGRQYGPLSLRSIGGLRSGHAWLLIALLYLHLLLAERLRAGSGVGLSWNHIRLAWNNLGLPRLLHTRLAALSRYPCLPEERVRLSRLSKTGI